MVCVGGSALTLTAGLLGLKSVAMRAASFSSEFPSAIDMRRRILKSVQMINLCTRTHHT